MITSIRNIPSDDEAIEALLSEIPQLIDDRPAEINVDNNCERLRLRTHTLAIGLGRVFQWGV